ncbi:MAG: signal peptidase I [Clostridia bacterium]|jgi:signal peptidase I|nr:signal peptidase I [Clostridia bacterium]
MISNLKNIPTEQEIKTEIKRLEYREKYFRTLKSTFLTIISVIAAFFLISTLVLPVFRTYGDAMQPTLKEGQLVVTLRTTKVKSGDLICFYYNNKVLIKRVIAVGGDTVNIDWHGNVSVNDVKLDEPYITEKAFGECNVSLPFKVPLSKVFVMGDNRSASVDSRHTEVGCISQEQIIGKLILRIWPLGDISVVK